MTVSTGIVQWANRTAKAYEVLRNPEDYKWTLQGFGFLRCYLDDGEVQRLHIWDPDRAYDEVSTIHDHPWHFSSHIISGKIKNQRFFETSSVFGTTFLTNEIRPGEGGGIMDPASERLTWLLPQGVESYGAGASYSMRNYELHESIPDRGTVSIITHEWPQDMTNVARVFWQRGDWVSAEPRPATLEEVKHFTSLALDNWNAS